MTDHQQAAVLALFEKIMGEYPTTPAPVRFALLSDEDKRVFREALAAAEPHLRKKWAEELERAMFKVESVHHFGFGEGGIKCLCGFESARNRSRTEHITQAVRDLVEGAGE